MFSLWPTWGSLLLLSPHIVIFPAALLQSPSDGRAPVLSRYPHRWMCQMDPSSSSRSQRTTLDPASRRSDRSMYHLPQNDVCGFSAFLFFCVYLRYDRESPSQVMQAYSGDIYTVDEDATCSRFNNSEQAVCQAWFSSSCAAHYTNLHEVEREHTKHKMYHFIFFISFGGLWTAVTA